MVEPLHRTVVAGQAYLRMLRRFNHSVRRYLVSSALFGFTVFGGIYALLLNLYLLRLGYGPGFVGLVNAAGMLMVALGSLPAGILGGRWGSRRALIVALRLIAVGLILLPCAELFPASVRAAWLVGTYMVAWLGVALYFVNTNPFLMRVTTPVERTYVFAVQAALWPIAGFSGSLVGGLLPGMFAVLLQVPLSHPAPYRYPLLIAALLFLPAVFAMQTTSELAGTPAVLRPGMAGGAPYRVIVLLSLATLLQLAGEGATRTYFNVYLDTGLGVPTAQIGAVMGVAQLIAVPAALLTPLLAAKLGMRGAVVASSCGMALSLLPLAVVARAAAAGLGYVGLTAMSAIRRPAISVFSMDSVPGAWQTRMSSATTTALGVSWCLVALGGGYIITQLGYQSFFLLAAGITGAGALLLWAAFPTRRG